MLKQIKFFTTLLMVLFLTISCSKSNPSNPDNGNTGNNPDPTKWKDKANYQLLQKIWQTTASSKSKVFRYTDNKNNNTGSINSYHTYPDVNGMNYNIVIESITWTSDTEGIMYGKYKYHPTLLGKYSAVAFRNLTESGVEFSETSQSAETLTEAQSTFTAASGTFTAYNAYTVYNKQ